MREKKKSIADRVDKKFSYYFPGESLLEVEG